MKYADFGFQISDWNKLRVVTRWLQSASYLSPNSEQAAHKIPQSERSIAPALQRTRLNPSAPKTSTLGGIAHVTQCSHSC